ncbi:MAG: right-handed parallel beta-helix repeat-containing protein [Ardenticatenales bacterium]
MNRAARPPLPRVIAATVGVAFVLVFGASRAPRTAHAQTVIYVNDTDDPTTSDGDCEKPSDRCTLRGAVARASQLNGGLVIRACFDATLVPGADACPTGVRALNARARGFDPATGKWTIRLTKDRVILLAQGGTFVDFRIGFPWAGPQDNRIIIESGGPAQESAFRLGSQRNVLAGFELRGSFKEAAIHVPGGVLGEPARLNQLGPGLIFAGMPEGAGIKLTSELATANTIIGNWCGITGDGTVVDPVFEDCVQIDQGAFGNIIGDLDPSNRNVFAASVNGGGVIVEGPDAADNAVQGNWFGMLATGKDTPTTKLKTGIQLILGPQRTKVQRNVISGNATAGIYLSDAAMDTEIDDNLIGTDPTGQRCVANRGYGIHLQGGPRLTKIRRNTIRCNTSGGILMAGASTRDNIASQNSISANNASNAISVIQGANGGIQAPRITTAMRTQVSGTSCALCTIEVFSDPDGEAETYEGNVIADGDGNWVFDKPEGVKGPFVTATATDGDNTSSTSAFKTLSGDPPTASPTASPDEPSATPATPSPAPTTPTVQPTTPAVTGAPIYLPWTASAYAFK